jgi:hypothetical protein
VRAAPLVLLLGAACATAPAAERPAREHSPEVMVAELLEAQKPKVRYHLERLGSDAPGEVTIAAQFDTIEPNSRQVLAFTFVTGPYACEDGELGVSDLEPRGPGSYEVTVCVPGKRVRIVAAEVLGERDTPHEVDVAALANEMHRRLAP